MEYKFLCSGTHSGDRKLLLLRRENGEIESATPDFNSVKAPREAADTSETGETRSESETAEKKTAVEGVSTSGITRN